MLKRFALCLSLLATLTLGGLLRAADAEPNAPAGHAQAEAGGGDSLIHTPGTEHHVVEFDVAQVLWVLIIFVMLLAILYPTAWKGVLDGLKKREDRIRKDISDAEESRKKAEETLRQYGARLAEAESKVREMISSATIQGEAIAAQIRAKGQQEAEEAKEKAVKDIDAASKHAVTELYEKAAELSTAVASKILRRSINADDQRDLVRQSLDQLQSVEK